MRNKFTVIGLGANGVDWSVEFFRNKDKAIEWANELWNNGEMETVVIRDKNFNPIYIKN